MFEREENMEKNVFFSHWTDGKTETQIVKSEVTQWVKQLRASNSHPRPPPWLTFYGFNAPTNKLEKWHSSSDLRIVRI